jgi:hypothetical protein
MSSNVHSQLPSSEVHTPYFKVFANSSARISDLSTTYLETDLYKKAIQLSDNTEWYLKSVDPTSWVQISGGSVGSSILYKQVSSDIESIIYSDVGADNPTVFSGSGCMTIPANTLLEGCNIKWRVNGLYNDESGNAQPSWIFNIGGQNLGFGGVDGANDEKFYFEFDISVVSIEDGSIKISSLLLIDPEYKDLPPELILSGSSGYEITFNTIQLSDGSWTNEDPFSLTINVTIKDDLGTPDSSDGITLLYSDIVVTG